MTEWSEERCTFAEMDGSRYPCRYKADAILKRLGAEWPLCRLHIERAVQRMQPTLRVY